MGQLAKLLCGIDQHTNKSRGRRGKRGSRGSRGGGRRGRRGKRGSRGRRDSQLFLLNLCLNNISAILCLNALTCRYEDSYLKEGVNQEGTMSQNGGGVK